MVSTPGHSLLTWYITILLMAHTRTFFSHLVYYYFTHGPHHSTISVNSSFHVPVHCDSQTTLIHVCMALLHLGQLVLAGSTTFGHDVHATSLTD